MAHTELALMKLNKEDLVGLLLYNQGKFNSLLIDFRNIFDELKVNVAKLEEDITFIKKR